MSHSMPGLPVHHQLPESTQTHVHWVGDAIQPSHPLLSPSPVLNLSLHQGLFQWVSSSHQVAKVLEFQLQQKDSAICRMGCGCTRERQQVSFPCPFDQTCLRIWNASGGCIACLYVLSLSLAWFSLSCSLPSRKTQEAGAGASSQGLATETDMDLAV